MRTYVTMYIQGEGSNRNEYITYAGPSRLQAFSFEVDDTFNHSAMVQVWVLSWHVGTYGLGEEFSTDKWILTSNEICHIEDEVNDLSKLLEVIQPMLQLKELLEEKERILNELRKEI